MKSSRGTPLYHLVLQKQLLCVLKQRMPYKANTLDDTGILQEIFYHHTRVSNFREIRIMTDKRILKEKSGGHERVSSARRA